MSRDNPYASLNRIFHEPNRLAIMSALGGAPQGLTFNELKDQCTLTDGNLSRHLRTLEEAGAVHVRKNFVGSRPRTTVRLSDLGKEGFVEYLKALEEVLLKASESVVSDERALNLRSLWENHFGTGILDLQ